MALPNIFALKDTCLDFSMEIELSMHAMKTAQQASIVQRQHDRKNLASRAHEPKISGRAA